MIEFELSEEGPAVSHETFAGLPGVQSTLADDGVLVLHVRELHAALPAVMDHVRSSGAELSRLTTRHASLEDVFVQLTGRHLRDGGK